MRSAPALRALAIATLLVACSESPRSDAPTAAPGASAHLAVAPVFSPAAVQAYRALVGSGAQITNVHISLRNLSGTAVLDTVIAFPSTVDVLSIDLPVSINGSQQSFDALVELRDANNVVLFSTTQRLTARTGGSVQPPQAVILQYVGPGSDAKIVSVSPPSAAVQPGATQNLLATATDSAGRGVSDLVVTWTSSDSTIATVASTGNTSATVTPKGPRGLVTFTATAASGATGVSQLTFLPQPSQLALVSGDGQKGVANTMLAAPFVVVLQGTDGKPIGGRLVTFRARNTGASVGVSYQTTDSTGRARTTLTLGRATGAYSFDATYGTLAPVTIGATATPAPVGPPTQVIPLSPMPKQFLVGVPPLQNFSAQLADANGTYVQQSGVTISAALLIMPVNQASTITVTTDTAGVFVLSIPAYIGPVGTITISLSSPTIPNLPSGTFSIQPGPGSYIQTLRDPSPTVQTGNSFAIAPIVTLMDVGGNITTGGGVSVTASIAGTGASLSGTTTVVTGSDGKATFSNLIVTGTPGVYKILWTGSGTFGTATSGAFQLTP